MASGSSRGSVLRSGWAGARRPSEHKRPDNEAVPVERRWRGRVRDLERRAEDPEPLIRGGGGGGWKLDHPEFVSLYAPGAIP